nr:hypothetical protein [uncultured Prevotella sp.]
MEKFLNQSREKPTVGGETPTLVPFHDLGALIRLKKQTATP